MSISESTAEDEAGIVVLQQQQQQDERNTALISDAAVRAKLEPFLRVPSTHLLPLPGGETEGDGAAEPIRLLLSPYPGRRAVLAVRPVDRPYDYPQGSAAAADGATPPARAKASAAPPPGPSPAYVYPAPLPCCPTQRTHGAAHPHLHGSVMAFFKVKEVVIPATTGTKDSAAAQGPYANLTYVLGETAVPFSALLESLAHARVTAIAPRRALIDKSWSLKWVKRPLPSDFAQVRPASFQKINHFPGSSLLGRKDGLHRLLTEAVEHLRQVQGTAAAQGLQAVFPQGFLLPQENSKLLALLRDPAQRGKRFIVKPTTAACGRGIYLLEAGPAATLPDSPAPAGPASDLPISIDAGSPSKRAPPLKAKTKSLRTVAGADTENREDSSAWIVQEYADRPFLAHGYKFDLRLYVVVTSYEPLRAYVYKEGLVRFATTPYYTTARREDEGNGAMEPAALEEVTAHLTNFTINKKSEDFVAPRGAEEADAPELARASKWSLSALAQYVEQRGFDWGRTWDRVEALLASVLLAVRPHVCSAVRKVEANINSNSMAAQRVPGPSLSGVEAAGTKAPPNEGDTSLSGSRTPEEEEDAAHKFEAPPLTCRGVGPYFEIYGIDVLLCRPEALPGEEERSNGEQGDTGAGRSLRPVVLEVNIMPSLSTHYSPLDQCIKGSFIADALTLVGLTSTAVKTPRAVALPVKTGDPFLDRLESVAALEACFTAEEERQRAPHFHPLRLFPSLDGASTPQENTAGHPPSPALGFDLAALLSLPDPCRRSQKAVNSSLERLLAEWYASKMNKNS